MRRIDVIRTHPYIELGVRSVFSMAFNEGAEFSDFLFEDIQIYDDVTTIIGFKTHSLKGATPAGQLSNFVFRNISITGTEVKSWYKSQNDPVPFTINTGDKTFSYFWTPTGDGSFIKDFKFENFTIGGKCVNSLADFPNGGAKTFGDVTGFSFSCS